MGWNRQHHSQTIHPAENFISINLFNKFCVVIWECLYLTSMVMEAVRGQTHYSEHTLWHSNSMFGSSYSAISWILEPKSWFLVFYKCQSYFSKIDVFQNCSHVFFFHQFLLLEENIVELEKMRKTYSESKACKSSNSCSSPEGTRASSNI